MPEPKSLTDNVPHEYILLPNVKHAFDPEGVGLKWSLEECEYCSKLLTKRNMTRHLKTCKSKPVKE